MESTRTGETPLLGIAVRHIMTSPPITVTADATLAEAAARMLGNSVGCLPVVDANGTVVGIVTDSDFTARRAGIPFSTLHHPQVLGEWLGEEGVERVYREARRRRIRDVMSTNVHGVAAGDSVERVLRLMMERDVKHVPVVEEGRAVGVMARHDLLKLMLEKLPAAPAE